MQRELAADGFSVSLGTVKLRWVVKSGRHRDIQAAARCRVNSCVYIARRIAALTLSVWKSGEAFDESRLIKQAA